mmetsp:Transcript_12603/g.16961  ORF Transcript_12603/g.16961 Transcript_12603/m.16961 type:complete len:94 (+) Transcript_12603:76-357(+)
MKLDGVLRSSLQLHLSILVGRSPAVLMLSESVPANDAVVGLVVLLDGCAHRASSSLIMFVACSAVRELSSECTEAGCLALLTAKHEDHNLSMV